MKIIEAYQVPDTFSKMIMELPVVSSCYKTMLGQVYYHTDMSVVALPTDWICKFDNEDWQVLTDVEYKRLQIVNEYLYGEQKSTEWSEEDEHRLKDIIYFLDTAKKHYASTVELDACIDWLKSLKDCIQPQNHWKPSEEHVHWLKWAINRLPDTEKANEAEAILEDLLKQLKEL